MLFWSREAFDLMEHQLQNLGAQAFATKRTVQAAAHAAAQAPAAAAAQVAGQGGGGQGGGHGAGVGPGVAQRPRALRFGGMQFFGGQQGPDLQGELMQMQGDEYMKLVAAGEPKTQATRRKADKIGLDKWQALHPAPQDVARQRAQQDDAANGQVLRDFNRGRQDVDPFAPIPRRQLPPPGTKQKQYEDAPGTFDNNAVRGKPVTLDDTNKILNQIADPTRQQRGELAKMTELLAKILGTLEQANDKNKLRLEIQKFGLIS